MIKRGGYTIYNIRLDKTGRGRYNKGTKGGEPGIFEKGVDKTGEREYNIDEQE